MKIIKYLISVLIAVAMSGLVNSQTVKIEKKPKTIEEFIKLRNEIAVKPEGGAAMFLLALKIYKVNKEFGKKCLVVTVKKGSLIKGNIYKGYQLFKSDMQLIERQIESKYGLIDSYIKGSGPENKYTVKLPYIYEFTTNPYSGDPASGSYKILVKCSGADSDRPIRLKKNEKGYWKADSWSSVLVGIKKIKSEETDDL